MLLFETNDGAQKAWPLSLSQIMGGRWWARLLPKLVN